jgi:4-diphosphocytidyl-2-C-methyl-D-erythritol kinase
VRIFAPAKLNLFLHITGQRADGFHNLETVFQLIDWCDELHIEPRSDGRICREPAPSDMMLAALSDADDLTVRAATLLREASGRKLGADIHVRKQIPVGGGLGGGSSDAATVLLALNELWELRWPVDRLASLALQLGSDVPVFVHGRSAFACGRGEVLEPLDLPPCWFLVVHPPVAISTKEIFNAPELTRDTPPLRIRRLPQGGGRNDCEAVVRQRYGAVAEVLDRLQPFGGRLTGTGSCVFASFGTEAEAQAVQVSLPARWVSKVAMGLPASPWRGQ